MNPSLNFSAIPTKFEQIQAPTESSPGLVKVYAERALENGQKELLEETYNTVRCFCLFYFS